MKPLAVYTAIYADESLSSWLIRSALNQGSEPLILTSYYWPLHRLWTYDIDRDLSAINPKIYNDMAELLGYDNYNFHNHSLEFYLHVINVSTNTTGIMPWVLPRSSRNRKCRLGQFFCPLCLQDTNTRYLKNDWRISWIIGCVRHGVLLHNRCGSCGQLYQPQLLQQGCLDISYCYHCRSKVYFAITPTDMNRYQLDMQKSLQQTLIIGQGEFLGEIISAKEWFMVLRYFLFLLRKTSNCISQYGVNRFIESLGIDLNHLHQKKIGLPFELLSNIERLNLLSLAYQIMQISKTKFSESLMCDQFTQNMFRYDREAKYPEILEKYFQLLPLPERRNSRMLREKQQVSVSSSTIQRKWDRLKWRYYLNQ